MSSLIHRGCVPLNAATRRLGVAVMSIVSLAVVAFAGCGDAECSGDGCGASSTGSGGAADDCSIDKAGLPFTFHITNTGTRKLRLTYGCGRLLPIKVLSADGELGIGEGSADGCEFSCDKVYTGSENVGCSDCGPGYGASLSPGEMVDIQWDRRVYVEHEADPKCSGHEEGNYCALGVLVTSPSTTGTLTICNDEFETGGYCSPMSEESIPFSINFAESELTIPVE